MPYEVPFWIFIIAGAAGMLLLSVIIFILWKVGGERREGEGKGQERGEKERRRGEERERREVEQRREDEGELDTPLAF